MSGAPPRAQVRARTVAQRDALDPAQVAALSQQAIDRFILGSGIAPAQWRGLQVGLYRALPRELDLRPLETQLTTWGARLCFPRVLDVKARTMDFAQGLVPPEGLDPSLAPGAFGIEEPPAHHPVVDPQQIDVIFIPGVAFGIQGERVGMGAGFYDRYLPLAPQALRIALAFDFQLLPAIEQEAWDQRVDWIWTERRQVQLRTWSPS